MSWEVAAIEAGAALLGGMLGPSARDMNKQQLGLQKSMDKQRPKWIRQGAEKAGFNPLVFAGPSGITPATPAGGMMGEGIARAGAAVADAYERETQLEIQRSQLELERERLEALREEIKLAPKVPGIYASGRKPGSGSPVGGDAETQAGGPDWPLTPHGVRSLNPNIGPRITMFGVNWRGSGAMSGGQTVEDAIGEGPVSWVTQPLVVADMVGAKVKEKVVEAGHNRGWDEWTYREKYKWPVDRRLPYGWKSGKSPKELGADKPEETLPPAAQALRNHLPYWKRK